MQICPLLGAVVEMSLVIARIGGKVVSPLLRHTARTCLGEFGSAGMSKLPKIARTVSEAMQIMGFLCRSSRPFAHVPIIHTSTTLFCLVGYLL